MELIIMYTRPIQCCGYWKLHHNSPAAFIAFSIVSIWGYHPPLPGFKLNLNPVQLRTFDCFRCKNACQLMRDTFRSCFQSKRTSSNMQSNCKRQSSRLYCLSISIFLLGFAAGILNEDHSVMDMIQRVNNKTGKSLYNDIIQILALNHLSAFET